MLKTVQQHGSERLYSSGEKTPNSYRSCSRNFVFACFPHFPRLISSTETGGTLQEAKQILTTVTALQNKYFSPARRGKKLWDAHTLPCSQEDGTGGLHVKPAPRRPNVPPLPRPGGS